MIIEGDIISHSHIISDGGATNTHYVVIRTLSDSPMELMIAIEETHVGYLYSNGVLKKRLRANVGDKTVAEYTAMPPHVRNRNPLKTIDVTIS